MSNTTPSASNLRLCAPRASSSKGRKMRSKRGAIRAVSPAWAASSSAGAWAGAAFIHSRASQGVTMNATASESNMPMLALMGIGLMYGPINPLTNAIGSSAAMTVRVARMVGPPTSSTAPGIISSSDLSA